MNFVLYNFQRLGRVGATGRKPELLNAKTIQQSERERDRVPAFPRCGSASLLRVRSRSDYWVVCVSVQAITWALGQTFERSSHKFVLVILANYADESGCCFPSIGRLSKDTSLDRKTVLASISALKDCGLLLDTGKRVGATKSVPIYRLSWQQSQKRDCLEAVPKTAASSPVFPHKQSQKRDTDPKGNRQEPSEGRKAPVSTSERISQEKYLERINSRIRDLKESDLPAQVSERKELRQERKRLLDSLGLKA